MPEDSNSTRKTRSPLETVFSYGVPIAAFLAAAAVALSLAFEKEHSKWAFWAAIVAAVAALWTAISQHRRELKIDQLNDDLRDSGEKNERLGEENRALLKIPPGAIPWPLRICRCRRQRTYCAI
jgi:cobalamin biosynthesis protein CobD/CbiB